MRVVTNNYQPEIMNTGATPTAVQTPIVANVVSPNNNTKQASSRVASKKVNRFFGADNEQCRAYEEFWSVAGRSNIVNTTLKRKSLRKTMLLTALSTYVPNVVMRYCIHSQSHVVPPVLETYPASVLFADISGFTPLAEKLARLGARGVELLTTHLNEYFGQMINLIFNHGGDIVKFAGDALLAIWPTSHGAFELLQHFLHVTD